MSNIECKLAQSEIEGIQKAFSDFIKMDGPRQPLPILAEKMFKVFNGHYDIVAPVLRDLQTLNYSSDQFGAYYPFLIDVTEFTEDEIASKRNISGIYRYLAKPLSLNNRLYLVCKEFYLEKGGYKKRLYSWFCDLYRIEKRPDLIDYTKASTSTRNPRETKTDIARTDSEKDGDKDIGVYVKGDEKEYQLSYLLNQAASILFNPEKDAITALIKAYKTDSEIEDELIRKVDGVYIRLRKEKEILSQIDLELW